MKKRNLFMTGILALALVFALAFTGCEEEEGGDVVEPPAYADFLDAWADDLGDGAFTFDLDSNEVTFYYGGNWGTINLTLEDVKWTPITKVENLEGWSINGDIKTCTYTGDKGDIATNTGDEADWLKTVILAQVTTGDNYTPKTTGNVQLYAFMDFDKTLDDPLYLADILYIGTGRTELNKKVSFYRIDDLDAAE